MLAMTDISGHCSGRTTVEAENATSVLLASPRSFCAGVQRAIETVERVLKLAAGPVYVRKQIVHNTVVVAELRERGAIFVDELDDIPEPAPAGAVVVFSAHGVSPAVRSAADARRLQVVDATCPLVTKVHSEAARFAARGDTVVLIGHRGHEESEGTMGVAPQSMVLVQTPADVAALDIAPDAQVSYLTQTTLAVDETAEVIDALRLRFPRLHEPPLMTSVTQQRIGSARCNQFLMSAMLCWSWDPKTRQTPSVWSKSPNDPARRPT